MIKGSSTLTAKPPKRPHKGCSPVRNVPKTDAVEKKYCAEYNAGWNLERDRRIRREALLALPPSPPIEIVGNIKVDHRECQGGTKEIKRSMIEYVASTGCDTAFTIAFGRTMTINDLQPAVKYIANKLQNSTAKDNQQFTHLECYVEHQQNNSHLHCLITFDNERLRERYTKLFPPGEQKCAILCRRWEQATYDSTRMRNRQATISYATKLQNARSDWDSVISSRLLYV